MENIIILVIVAVIVGLAARYVYRAKKNGAKCIGCPSGHSCGSNVSGCNCGGNCSCGNHAEKE